MGHFSVTRQNQAKSNLLTINFPQIDEISDETTECKNNPNKQLVNKVLILGACLVLGKDF